MAALLKLAFAAYHFQLNAQYRELAGLCVEVSMGPHRDPQVVPLALDFGRRQELSILFRDLDHSYFGGASPHSFAFHPRYHRYWSSTAQYTGEIFQEPVFGWSGRIISDQIAIGGQRFTERLFGHVENYARPVAEYQEVAGLLSANRMSWLTQDRIISFSLEPPHSSPELVAKMQSLGSRRFPWPPRTISIPLPPREEDPRWSFPANLVIMGRNDQHSAMVVVDLGSSDILLPLILWDQIRDMGSFRLFGDGNRLYATEDDRVFTLSFHTDGLLRQQQHVGLNPESLRFPSLVENANAFVNQEGNQRFIPLRIRFAADLNHVVVGKALLETFKRVYLDNIKGMIRLVPRFSLLGRDHRSMVPPLVKLESLVPDQFDLVLPGLILGPVGASHHPLDDFLVPVRFRRTSDSFASRRSFELVLARRFPRNEVEARNTFQLINRDLSDYNCQVSASHGLQLYGTWSDEREPLKFVWVTITKREGEIVINLQEGQERTRRSVISAVVVDGEYDCSICCEKIMQGEVQQSLPYCKHSFHRRCIEPWIAEGKNSCPNCRCRF